MFRCTFSHWVGDKVERSIRTDILRIYSLPQISLSIYTYIYICASPSIRSSNYSLAVSWSTPSPCIAKDTHTSRNKVLEGGKTNRVYCCIVVPPPHTHTHIFFVLFIICNKNSAFRAPSPWILSLVFFTWEPEAPTVLRFPPTPSASLIYSFSLWFGLLQASTNKSEEVIFREATPTKKDTEHTSHIIPLSHHVHYFKTIPLSLRNSPIFLVLTHITSHPSSDLYIHI